MSRKLNVNNWGRSRTSLSGPASQLARVEFPEPTDVTVYLFGWRDQGSTAVTAGAYDISFGAGGVAMPATYPAAARGTVLHFCASVVQVNSVGTATQQHVDRVTLGRGRPAPWSLASGAAVPGGAALSAAIELPPWTTRVVVEGVYDITASPRLPVATATVVVFAASDPTFAGGVAFRIADLATAPDRSVPLGIDAGFLKFASGGPPSLAVIRIEGIQ